MGAEENTGTSKTFEELISDIGETGDGLLSEEGSEEGGNEEGGNEEGGNESSEPSEEGEEEEAEEVSASKTYADRMRVESAARKEAQQYREQAEQLQQQLAVYQPIADALQKQDGGLSVLQALNIDPQDTIRAMVGEEKPAPKIEDEVAALKEQLQQMLQAQQAQQYQAVVNNYVDLVTQSLKTTDGNDEIMDFLELSGSDLSQEIQTVWSEYSTKHRKNLQPAELAGILSDEIKSRLRSESFVEDFKTQYERMQRLASKILSHSAPAPDAPKAQKPDGHVIPTTPVTGGDAFAGRESISADEMAEAIKKEFGF